MKHMKRMTVGAALVVIGIAIGVYFSQGGSGIPAITPAAQAAGGRIESPTQPAPDRYVYYPGTEALLENEIRVICCGSGMPAARHGQAACSWLIECGNGDKLLFDLGTGSMANIAALMIPYQYLDKVFLSHLHTCDKETRGRISKLAKNGMEALPVSILVPQSKE